MAEPRSAAFRCLARRLFGESLLLALLVTFFAIVAVPEWNTKPYEAPPSEAEIVDLPPELPLPERPREAARLPEIPIEAEDDESIPPEETIARTILDPDTPLSTPAIPQLLAIGDFVQRDTEPQFIRFVTPEYPRLAVLSQVEGVVFVQMLVDTRGRVVDARATGGPEILREAAVRAALMCLLTPAMQGDRPVAVWVSLPFRFTLKDAP
jgi:protein TonB